MDRKIKTVADIRRIIAQSGNKLSGLPIGTIDIKPVRITFRDHEGMIHSIKGISNVSYDLMDSMLDIKFY